MDEIYRAKLQNNKEDSPVSASPSSTKNKVDYGILSENKEPLSIYDLGLHSSALTNILDLDSLSDELMIDSISSKKQKIQKKNDTNETNENEVITITDNENHEIENTNEINNVANSSTNVDANKSNTASKTLEDVNSRISKKRKTRSESEFENNVTSIYLKKILLVLKEAEEKKIRVLRDTEEKKLILKRSLAEKEIESRREIEEKKIEIQKAHNLDMKNLREHELKLEEARQKFEKEKLEFERSQFSLQLKLFEDKLVEALKVNPKTNSNMENKSLI